ncbi:hypothetical protein GCM10010246_13280 [Streptomyces cuspidosporus]|uniref:Uncharacterized protein n=1 Tax=Streptomyces cuspidosporus TaxID=66882 RepID=A0ABP5SHH5_9ACTN
MSWTDPHAWGRDLPFDDPRGPGGERPPHLGTGRYLGHVWERTTGETPTWGRDAWSRPQVAAMIERPPHLETGLRAADGRPARDGETSTLGTGPAWSFWFMSVLRETSTPGDGTLVDLGGSFCLERILLFITQRGSLSVEVCTAAFIGLVNAGRYRHRHWQRRHGTAFWADPYTQGMGIEVRCNGREGDVLWSCEPGRGQVVLFGVLGLLGSAGHLCRSMPVEEGRPGGVWGGKAGGVGLVEKTV